VPPEQKPKALKLWGLSGHGVPVEQMAAWSLDTENDAVLCGTVSVARWLSQIGRRGRMNWRLMVVKNSWNP